jgi:predicted deacylase
VGPITARSGEIAKGLLPVGELADGCTPAQVPVMIVNGAEDGPIAYLHAGSHGQETVYAIDLMRQLVRGELDPGRLRGAVILVPAANLLAHQAASRIAPHYGVREGVPFGGDLHKLWPGDAAGSITQRIASTIWREIVAQADVVVDYHTNSSPGLPFTLLYQHSPSTPSPEDEAVWQRTLELAGAFGLTVVRGAPTPNALSGASMLAGKPAMMVEVPSPRLLNRELVASALIGTRNVLAHAGLIDAPIEPQRAVPVLPGEHVILPSIRANRGGMVGYEVTPGDFCPADTVIARVYDVFGDEVEAVRMAEDGYVSTFPPLSWAGAQAIASGDYVADCFS